MTEQTELRALKPGEMEVLADGGVRWSGRYTGDMYSLTAAEVLGRGCETAQQYAEASRDLNGYKIIRADSIAFPSGSVVLTDGSHITGRIEPEAATYAAPTGNRLLTTEELLADLRKVLESVRAQGAIPEPQRAPLPHFNQQTPFDTFGPGFKVRSDTGWMTGEDGHPLQRMTADSQTHGSAHLLKD